MGILNYELTGPSKELYDRLMASDFDIASLKKELDAGKYDTDEVVQVYVRDLESPYEVTNYRLCGFTRVSLKAGESRKAYMTLDKNAFTLINDKGERVSGSGHYRLWGGISQPDAQSLSLTNTPCLECEVRL